MKRSWSEVETELLDNVFYAHDPQEVRAAGDLTHKGMLDSLSIVAILETLVEAGGDEDKLEEAQATDFRNLAVIRDLYDRV